MDRYSKKYVRDAIVHGNPIVAFCWAAASYIRVREGWLRNNTVKNYGWRGGWKSGKLFFNKTKTQRNVNTVRSIVDFSLTSIGSNGFNIDGFKHHVRLAQRQLTKKGRGNLLVSMLMDTVKAKDLARFTPGQVKKLKIYTDTDLYNRLTNNNTYRGYVYDLNRKRYDDNNLYLKSGNLYRGHKEISSGSYGDVHRLRNIDTHGYDLVMKVMESDGDMSRSNRFESPAFNPLVANGNVEIAARREGTLFNEVLNTLGIDILLHDTFDADYYPESGDHKIIMPYIRGYTLLNTINRTRASRFDQYDCFDQILQFLFMMHSMCRITHNDLHLNNIFILNSNSFIPFFIDFGYGKKHENVDPAGTSQADIEFRKAVIIDIAWIIVDILHCREIRNNRSSENLHFKKLVAEYPTLKNWIYPFRIDITELIRRTNLLLDNRRRKLYHRVVWP
ncbi:MAG: protein kinase family protein [Lentisphaerae bacterium]|nr:protein kinase family protein [Lentisphaerota bacterium]MCP4100177.1 protein kinase family protein [Lentisphaerota bacterium]